MWIEDVEREAGVTLPRPLAPEWACRLLLWHESGETVGSAAAMLRVLDANQKRENRSWEFLSTLTCERRRSFRAQRTK